jgi:hypothetical protein
MRISLAAKRKLRVDGHEGAELRLPEIEKEAAESAKAREQKKQTPGSTAQGRLRFGLGLRWSAQTAVADVAGGDGIAGQLPSVKENRNKRHVTQGRRIQRQRLFGDRLAASPSPVRDSCARRSANIMRYAQEPDSAAVMRDLERTGG